MFIGRVLCSGPGFRYWEYSIRLTELAQKGEAAAVCLTNDGADPGKLSDTPRVTARLRLETRPIPCRNPSPCP